MGEVKPKDEGGDMWASEQHVHSSDGLDQERKQSKTREVAYVVGTFSRSLTRIRT